MTERVQRAPELELRDDLLDGVDAIADYTGLPKRKIYYLIEIGALPAKKLGHRTIIGRKSEIDAALRKGGVHAQ